MTESEYFGYLEMRISRELAGMARADLRGWWCDGFLVEKFVATGKGCHVAGRVWMDGSGAQTLWNFVVLLGPFIVEREAVQWSGLLPAEDATGWLSLDFENRFMKIKPYAASLDPSF
ncbi:MAG: hypothetical protein JWN40_881 [Phycisphaerales bacterium]|nr:hypothetical protein [Phycisphaerales bacterium]